MGDPIRVVLADDDPAFLEALVAPSSGTAASR
jgi:hypothetical protein